MRSLITRIAGLYLTASLAAPLQADEISEQLTAASAAYEQGQLQTSVQGLQFVIAAIQERIEQSLLKLLPEPLPGWKSGGIPGQFRGHGEYIRRHPSQPPVPPGGWRQPRDQPHGQFALFADADPDDL